MMIANKSYLYMYKDLIYIYKIYGIIPVCSAISQLITYARLRKKATNVMRADTGNFLAAL